MNKEIKRNYLYNLFYRIVTMATPLITAPYISRVLGASGIGEYSYSFAISHYFLIFAVLGVSDYGNRSIARVKNNKKIMNEVFSEIFSLQIILAVVMLFLYTIYVFFVSENKFLAIIQGINVLTALVDLTWLMFGLEQFLITTIRNVIVKIIGLIFIILFVKTPSDVWIYALIMAGTTFVGQVSLLPLVYKFVDYRKPRFKNIIKHLKPNLVLFLPVVANNLLGYFDKIMIGNLSIKSELGCYDNAEKLISIPNSLITALGTVMLPRITNSLAMGEKSKVERLTKNSMLFTLFSTSAFAFGISAVAREFVPLFFGEGFDIVVYLIYILAPLMICVSWSNVLKTQCLLPKNLDSIYVKCLLFGAIVNIILNYFMIPIYGSIGAAFTTTLAEFLIAFSESFILRKQINIKRYFLNGLPFIINGLIMFLSISNIYVKNGIITIIIKVLSGCIIYLLLSYIYFFKIYKKIEIREMGKSEKNNMY